MSNERPPGPSIFRPHTSAPSIGRRLPLKRGLDWFSSLQGFQETAYPSPPMSNPPSPPRSEAGTPSQQQKTSTATVSAPRTTPPTTIVPQQFIAPLYPLTIPSTSTAPPWSSHMSTTMNIPATPASSFQPGPMRFSFTAGPATSPPSAGPSSARGRKAKAHVASACVNCKKAHLSCDVQRPCARCVATGKQDTCYDVQHKKRGRPRLREEGEFRVEAPSTQTAAPPASMTAAGQPPARPLAGPRQRRAESFRSLRSQTSEGSSSYGPTSPGYLASFGTRGGHVRQQSSAPTFLPPSYEVPTALLNLDLVVIRANRPFQQIMLGGRELQGRWLGDFAAPADQESFIDIRNRLRAEREAREPAYLPPILGTGQDPLQGVSENDVDHFAQGFTDRTYTWTQTQIGMAAQTFPARVRLARASTYFVAVTLPSFRPIEQLQRPLPPPLAPPFGVSPTVATPESYTLHTPSTSQITPAQPGQSYPGMSPPRPPSQMPPYTSPRTYPPLQPSAQYQSQQYPPYPQPAPPPAITSPRFSTTDAPIPSSPFTPRTIGAQQALGPGVQSPPLGGSPSSPSGSTQPAGTAVAAATAPPQDFSSEEEDSGEGGGVRSPRKRRRMGIHDVLQR